MTSNWDPVSGLDDTCRRVQRMFAEELSELQLTSVDVHMKPISASDRNPTFTIQTPTETYDGVIAEETAALETDEELRQIIRGHLLHATGVDP